MHSVTSPSCAPCSPYQPSQAERLSQMEDRVRILETQLGLAHPQVACAAAAGLLDWAALGSCNAADELMPAAGCPWARCVVAASHKRVPLLPVRWARHGWRSAGRTRHSATARISPPRQRGHSSGEPPAMNTPIAMLRTHGHLSCLPFVTAGHGRSAQRATTTPTASDPAIVSSPLTTCWTASGP